MLYKGSISSINDRKARVYIQSKGYLTNEIPISGRIIDIKINDNVLVEFLENSMSEGMIIENLSRNSEQIIPTKTSQLENDSGFITLKDVPELSTYIFNQISPSSTWDIVHNLNKYPSITIVDSAGTVVIGDAEYINLNEIRITFSTAFAGTAYLN